MRVSVLIATLASATAVSAACAADNCLRNVRGQPVGRAFCATFTTAVVNATIGLPAGILPSCGVVRLSSACSCVFPASTAVSTTLTTATTTTTTISSTTTTGPTATTSGGSVCSETFTSFITETIPASTITIAASVETVTLPPFTLTVSLPIVTATIISTITLLPSIVPPIEFPSVTTTGSSTESSTGFSTESSTGFSTEFSTGSSTEPTPEPTPTPSSDSTTTTTTTTL
ncbi:hypothetical protein CDEST_06207 [Colletotrichum destructivum]|uniref:Uncharacterized protein n=1 Tax=Colletotrichum destructivum TaxID=34406 RepID=A0AAX4IE11_9PEZI|nr:hypothetical protein CDEST_06207 [Colletotrichum destructivum]